MDGFRQQLLVGGSWAALVAATSFYAPAAWAQAANTAVEEVTVTGTSIRGTAPVGSNVITVDQQAIQTAGAKNMQELLNTIPALSTANAPPQGTNNNSFFAPQIHQLAGAISNSTLAVVDGMRFVGAGGDTLADPNIIPTVAIQRVEVLADGASSIYGSDAVSGVVNGDGITATYASTAVLGSPVGPYDITSTLVDPNFKAANYAVTLNTGTLTINPAALTVAVDSANKA